ncbi:isopeptide-forming domain-containing fimbrial protein [Acutalibacter sp. JLR.KK004]|uniref:isopeptide-forming domain-containing fimbrial protein n=1 Tax=Acutalibacter sp. JLR.KK004 TaxID=3112622 RepID=UPI002FF1F19F
MKRSCKKMLAALLAVLAVLSTFALPAGAKEAVEPGSLGSVTETFIDEATGREIADPRTAKSSWTKEPPHVEGYEYQGFTQATRYVYSQEDLTYILGYPDKTVHGEWNLTRAETAAIFYRLHAGAFPAPKRQMSSTTFRDVPQNAWYYKELEMCYNLELANGTDGNRFAPDSPITRAEFAAFAARFAQLENSGKALFNDVTPDHWAYQAVNAAAEAGWIKGYPDGSFKPDDFITRAEAVSLINRMRNRVITAEELKALGIANPYTDLVETYWAYGDLLEATIKHSAADWHKLNFTDGMDQVTERFVDEKGREIAESVTTSGTEKFAHKDIENFHYMGYITEVTYVYTDGRPAAAVTKSVDKREAKVGDTLTYTIQVQNAPDASADLENAVLTDPIPSFLTFTRGSVEVDGESARHSYNTQTRELSVKLGDIRPGEEKTVVFTALVNDTAYGQAFRNTAVVSSDNGEPGTGTDEGVSVSDGKAKILAEKSVDKSAAQVGDVLHYTVKAGNMEDADVALENAALEDVIPEDLEFSYGSVQVDGVSASYSFDSASRLLSVKLGDLQPGEMKTVTFAAAVKDSAYNKTIQNTAVLSADNCGDTQAKDQGVVIGDGKAWLQAEKSVDKSTAQVGDTLTYTIKAQNAGVSAVSLRDVKVTDYIPSYVDFAPGSVEIDGSTAVHSYDGASRTLTVELGEIAPDEEKTVTFRAVVNSTAYNKSFQNVAVLTSENAPDVTVKDGGTVIGDGFARMYAQKAVDRDTARVGDILTYTVTAQNSDAATVNLRSAVMTDVLPEYVTFCYGSVQVDGLSAPYAYDNAGRALTVELGDLAPAQIKTITFNAAVNSSAYGQTFQNTAVLSSENDNDKPAADTGVTVDPGEAQGSVGAKTVDRPYAHVGEELTYTITLENGQAATAPWEGASVTDVIPEHLSFVAGSVEQDGQATANYAYDAGTKTLTLLPESIGIGESTRFTFRVTVEDGAQGQYIVNTAVLHSPGKEDSQLPDTGVQIDGGETKPDISKTANVTEAHPGDVIRYTLQVQNGADATADWKNVVVTDVLPAGVKLVYGSVMVNGDTGDYGMEGQSVTLRLGDLVPGQSARITFEARLEDAVENTTIYNTATAKGDNGEKTVTDPGVAVLPLTPQNPNDVGGSKDVDKTVVQARDKVTYTITARNGGKDLWQGVQAYDVLDSSRLTLINDTVYIDGVRYMMGSGKWFLQDGQLVLNLGDIPAGESVEAKFTVQFKADAANSTYINYASLQSNNKPAVHVKAPEVTILGNSGGSSKPDAPDPTSDIHYKLFSGFGEHDGTLLYEWEPDSNISRLHMCYMAYRLMSDGYKQNLPMGTVSVPDPSVNKAYGLTPVRYFISHGVLERDAFVNGSGDSVWATRKQIYALLEFATGKTLGSDAGQNPMKRIDVAKLVCQVTGRDPRSNTNGCLVVNFTDSGSNKALIDEVSNSHEYTMDSMGNETWIRTISEPPTYE